MNKRAAVPIHEIVLYSVFTFFIFEVFSIIIIGFFSRISVQYYGVRQRCMYKMYNHVKLCFSNNSRFTVHFVYTLC